MTTSTKKALIAYREAIRRQVSLRDDRKWTMGEEIKRLKTAAYVEIEHDKMFNR